LLQATSDSELEQFDDDDDDEVLFENENEFDD
jgi:hypothetical protein